MNECVPRDTLVNLASTTDGPILPLIDHLAACPACREEVAALARIRADLAAEEELPPGFVDRVMDRTVGQTMGQAVAAQPLVRGSRAARVAELVGLVALVAAAVLVVLFAGSMAQLEGRTPAGDLVYVAGSLVAGAVVALKATRRSWTGAPDAV